MTYPINISKTSSAVHNPNDSKINFVRSLHSVYILKSGQIVNISILTKYYLLYFYMNNRLKSYKLCENFNIFDDITVGIQKIKIKLYLPSGIIYNSCKILFILPCYIMSYFLLHYNNWHYILCHNFKFSLWMTGLFSNKKKVLIHYTKFRLVQ